MWLKLVGVALTVLAGAAAAGLEVFHAGDRWRDYAKLHEARAEFVRRVRTRRPTWAPSGSRTGQTCPRRSRLRSFRGEEQESTPRPSTVVGIVFFAAPVRVSVVNVIRYCMADSR